MNCPIDFKATQNEIFLSLSRKLTYFLTSRGYGDAISVEVQFNISGNQFDQWRTAVRLLTKTEAGMDMIFPDLGGFYKKWFHASKNWWILPNMELNPWIPGSVELNLEQKKLVHHSVTRRSWKGFAVPPLVVFGPFGTGKTRTMACAVSRMLMGEGNWSYEDGLILICTHSHPTADLYLKLIEQLCSGRLTRDDLRKVMIRLFPKSRLNLDTLPDHVRAYVPTEADGSLMVLSAQQIQRARVVVCTLFGANRLVQLCSEGQALKISHIFVDEAAQSLEAETLMPLCMASRETRVIVAGDHNQIRPKVYLDKKYAGELNMSYLERLYYHYDSIISKLDETAKKNYTTPNLLFNKNYRCHKGILEFVSAEFYGNESSLEPCGDSPETKLAPLMFHCVDDGREMQDRESTSWFNWREGEAVAATVEFLYVNWPSEWGSFEVGVLVAYHDQVATVKDCLRRTNIPWDSTRNTVRNVGKVVSMQGKEFKALVISVVLTRHVLQTEFSQRNLGFLDDPKLINTAMTRARYSVTVVGDPLALCGVGGCKEMWKRYLKRCSVYRSIIPRNKTLESIERDLDQLRKNRSSAEVMGSEKYRDLSRREIRRSLDPDRLIEQLIEKTEMERLSKDVEPVVADVHEGNGEGMVPVIGQRSKEEEAVLHIQSAYRIFATTQDRSKVIHIRSRKFCKTAFNGDVVLVEVTDTNGEKIFGQVTEVLEHLFHPENCHFVCFADPYNLGQMVPIDPRIPKICTKIEKSKDTVSLLQHSIKANSKLEKGDPIQINRVNCWDNLYVVMYIKWDETKWCPWGMIVDTIQLEKDKTKVSTLKEQGLKIININNSVDDYKWPLDCFKQQECSKETIASAEKDKSRQDIGKLFPFTIDPPDSKDLDDAMSIEWIGNDLYEVGVHIADVSAVVSKGSALDKEAKERGQTLYPSELGEPLHMLPDLLSTKECSLLVNQDRLTVSVFIEVRFSDGQIMDHRFTRSKIRSNHRLTYSEVEKKLDSCSLASNSAMGLSSLDNRLSVLHALALKLRRKRLGEAEALFHDCSHMEFPKAELLVSEWMIMTNHLVAGRIRESFGDLTPVRKQLAPAEQLLEEWKKKHGDVLPFSFKYSTFVETATSEATGGPQYFTVPKFHWENIVKTKSVREQKILLGFEELHPLMVLPEVDMRLIQERSVYTPVGGALGVSSHHQLNLPLYTHFTSPIRRYIDIVVHRMLVSALEGKECPYDLEELKEICCHCTEMNRKGKDYESQCFNLKMAISDQTVPQTMHAVIYQVNEVDLRLEIPTLETRVDSLKRLKYNHLYLKKNPEIVENGQRHRVLLTWHRELYSLAEQKGGSSRKTNRKTTVVLPSDQHVVKIPTHLWKNLQEAVKKDAEGVQETKENFERHLNEAHVAASKEKSSCPEPTSELFGKGDPVVKKCEARFCTTWEESTLLKVQVGAQLHRGLLQPAIQLLHLTPKLNLCIEHVRNASGCFALRPSCMIQKSYKTVSHYQKAWIPVLLMESAYSVVSSRESVVVSDVNVEFSKDNGIVKACFHLPEKFCLNRMIQLSSWSEEDPEVSKEMKEFTRLDCFCIKTPVKESNVDFIWVGHFVSVEMERVVNEKVEFDVVRCNLVQSGSAVSEKILCGKPLLSTVEIFVSPVQFREMQRTVLKLQEASLFARRIALGRCPVSSPDAKEKRDLEQLIREIKTKFPAPNKYQKEAILTALSHPFTLIWGPPGTGKTVTAVRLACCFVKMNKTAESGQSTGSPKLLYCAPSNKAVNVVGRWFIEKMSEEKTIRIVRVYARELERTEFPLPFDRTASNQDSDGSEIEGLGIDKKLKDISLHHLIRQSNNRFARKILELDAEFSKIKTDSLLNEKVKLSTEDILGKIKFYKRTVKLAERCALANCDIILCTCTAANLGRLHFLQPDKDDKLNFRIKQVILDEASMSSEPESLIPLITTKCENFVLVGDHKQLTPVILCKEAKDFGMDSTLFSKYANKAVMLQTQYRMFYDGKLNAGLPVQRSPGNDVWPLWKKPIAFAHCEGTEEMRVVTTEDAAEMSASNKLEVAHVVRVVNGLVLGHGVKPENIAVLSQYRAQVKLVKDKLSDSRYFHLKNMKKNVLSVVNSQVRSLPVPEIDPIPSISWIQKHIGSVADDHQICVALTRAKKGLLIIGNGNLLKVNTTWKGLINYYKKNGCFVDSAGDFMAGFK